MNECTAELKGGMIKIVNLTDLQAVLFNDLLQQNQPECRFMSGGHFDYVQYKMDDAAITIQEKIKDYDKTCLPETLEKMKIAAELIDKAGRMLHRIDWFVSGDDGEECFNRRWDEDGL